MITVDLAVSFAINNRIVIDSLGNALRSDLVVANPYLRRIVEFADGFVAHRRTLPALGDWEVWLATLHEGLERDGTREALNRCLATDLSGYNASYFAEQAGPHLKAAAARVARARMNEVADVTPELIADLARRVDDVGVSTIAGLARLEDIDVWARPYAEDALIPTGFPTIDRIIGGWGKELWMVFADSGVGKSTLLQCWAIAAALRGKLVLHVSLEIGLRPQINRYYRNITQMRRGEFVGHAAEVKRRLEHWLRFASGSVRLLELPAYSLTPDELRRTIDRVERAEDKAVDVLVLDYLDLMSPPKDSRGRGAYEELGVIAHSIRGLTTTHDMTVLTASQAVRKPKNPGKLGLHDMGDSYKKIRAADGVMALMWTPEEEEVQQGRIRILKARDSGGRNIEVPVYVNHDYAYVGELNHPNTMLIQKIAAQGTP